MHELSRSFPLLHLVPFFNFHGINNLNPIMRLNPWMDDLFLDE